MLNYFLRRLMWLIPTFFTLTLIAFLMLQSAPGDPVRYRMGKGSSSGDLTAGTEFNHLDYQRIRREMGLDLPLFYFSIVPLSVPDSIEWISNYSEKKAVHRLCLENGNTEAILHFRNQVKSFKKDTFFPQNTKQILQFILESENYERINKCFSDLLKQVTADSVLNRRSYLLSQIHFLIDLKVRMETSSKVYRSYIPAFRFNGLHNRYHRWLVNLFSFDFGYSYADNKPVGKKIWEVIGVTLSVNLSALILIILISVPTGIRSAGKRLIFSDFLLNGLYAVPSFWLGTLMLVFLCGGDYLDWFPPGGLTDVRAEPDRSFLSKLSDYAYHLILPVLAISLGNMAYLTRQIRTNIESETEKDYIRTARAKGLSEKAVINKHALKNALLPTVHWLGNYLPVLAGGSLLAESIFSLPGMGTLMYDAIQFRDYPTIIAIFSIISFLTLTGQLAADMAYAYLDPRIRLGN